MKYNYEIGDKVIYHDKEFVIVSTMPDGSGVFIGGHWVDIKNIKPINKGEQMTNKQEAKQQLEKLEAEVQKLKEIINKPEKARSLINMGGSYFISNTGKYLTGDWGEFGRLYQEGANTFSSIETAQAYADAFNTMLALRKCEGSCISGDIPQYVISTELNIDTLEIYLTKHSHLVIPFISPSFISKECAQAAIDKVGKDNIIKMFKTLHGIYV